MYVCMSDFVVSLITSRVACLYRQYSIAQINIITVMYRSIDEYLTTFVSYVNI